MERTRVRTPTWFEEMDVGDTCIHLVPDDTTHIFIHILHKQDKMESYYLHIIYLFWIL